MIQLLAFEPPEEWWYYRVAAETNYGMYKFAVVAHKVPQWHVLEQFCCWHTRLP